MQQQQPQQSQQQSQPQLQQLQAPKRPVVVRTTPAYLPTGGDSAAAAAAAAAKRRRLGGVGGIGGGAAGGSHGGFALPAPATLSERAIQLAPECGAYRELWRLEHRLDEAIRARRAALHEAQRRQAPRPRRRIRLQLSSHFGAYGPDGEPGWELRIEGRALDDSQTGVVGGSGTSLATGSGGSGSASTSLMSASPMSASPMSVASAASGSEAGVARRRFSSYLSCVTVELDRTLYGPEAHLAEWSRADGLADTDGFVVRRAGEHPVRVTVLITPEHQPPQFRLQPQLAKLLGLHSGTRAQAVQAFWRYATEKSLLDPLDRAAACLVLDQPLAELFRPDGQSTRESVRVPASDVPRRLQQLLLPPEPLILHYLVSAEPGVKRCVNYELEMDAEDPAAKAAAAAIFPFNSPMLQELSSTEARILDTVEQMNAAAQQAEFYSQFASDPQQFLTNALLRAGSQQQQHHGQDPDEERRAGFFAGGWLPEAAAKYFSEKIDQRRQELEQLFSGAHPTT